ncbi:MAG: hypothetical protein JWP22_938 [Ramlibacter sp.]|jgi:hypothetical protein|nr:hypothetical protein [Ramlibacter sp.]MDB5912263.1 hypothetical protein [Ramlibacter sp.]
MFDRIKKAFQRDPRDSSGEAQPSQSAHGPVSEWAGTRGMSFSTGSLGHTVTMNGKIGGRSWRMELGRPSRDYITGEELRARAELGVDDDVGAMVINRPLKEALERRAYSMITDTLQTTADPRLPEEMRWLAMYDEIGWEGPEESFWSRYAVLADSREHAVGWVDDALVRLLTAWPEPGPGPQVPFMIVLLRGKAYLRMQYLPADTRTLDHATAIFTSACENALRAFKGR